MAKKMDPIELQRTVLHSAYILFTKKGFDNVIMQNIVDESGIPMADILKYYPSKRDLYNAILQGVTKFGKTEIAKDVSKEGSSAKETIISGIESSFSDETIKKMIPILMSTVNVPNAFALNMHDRVWEFTPFLAESIRKGIDEGCFSTEFPDECAELFMLLTSHWNEKHTLEYNLEHIRRRYDFLQKLMKQLGVDIVTDNLVEKLVKISGVLYKAGAGQTDK
jgi:AcrR family transcriptional regulator